MEKGRGRRRKMAKRKKVKVKENGSMEGLKDKKR
jgi:hypothetical protein